MDPPEGSGASEIEGEDPSDIRRPITEKLLRTMQMSFNQQFNRRKQTIDQALHAHERGRKVFWEVYSGSGNLADHFSRQGWEVMKFDYDSGWDFDDAMHRREFHHLQSLLCPEFVWFAPPCTVWSPLQNINVDTPARAEADRDYQEATHLRLCLRGYNRQLREGRHAAVEQPQLAASWRTKTFATMAGHDALFHQCSFGCRLPDEDGTLQLIKKPTVVRCTDDWTAFELSRGCTGDHYHLPIEGSSPGIGSRSEAAGIYQPSLCRAFYKAIEGIFTREQETAYVGDQEEDDEPEVPEPEPVSSSPADRGILQRLHQEDSRQAVRTVARLHRNLGHPTNRELVRLPKEQVAPW